MDISQYFGNDITVNNVGDLALVDGITLSQQRILRRLLTNPGTYTLDPTYGAGLPRYIGQPLTPALYKEIVGLITANMYQETSVSQDPPPVIALKSSQDVFYVNIQYTESATTTLQILSFTVRN